MRRVASPAGRRNQQAKALIKYHARLCTSSRKDRSSFRSVFIWPRRKLRAFHSRDGSNFPAGRLENNAFVIRCICICISRSPIPEASFSACNGGSERRGVKFDVHRSPGAPVVRTDDSRRMDIPLAPLGSGGVTRRQISRGGRTSSEITCEPRPADSSGALSLVSL
jgi:hypothetical protein